MEASREHQILVKLEEVLEQGRNNAAALQLTRTMLFGSEEDDYKAGRLPVAEARITALEDGRASGTRHALRWLGKAILVGLGAIIHSFLPTHR